MSDWNQKIWSCIAISFVLSSGVSCHLQNQSGASFVGSEGTNQSLKGNPSALLSSVLDASSGMQAKYCPSAQIFVAERVGASLVTSCMTCHQNRRYPFNLDSGLSDGDQFTALVTYLKENAGGVSRAAEHDLVLKAGGGLTGGG